MKITFEKAVLLDRLAPVMGAVSTRNTIATISGILFTTVDENTCSAVAYDLEKGIRTTIPCRVEREGSYILNANKFTQIVRSLSDEELTVDIDDKNIVSITSGRSQFGLHALKGRDFPSMPELGGDHPFPVKQKHLRAMIGKTLFSVAQNDVKPTLNGLYLEANDEKITAASTDHFVLSVCSMNCSAKDMNDGSSINKSLILPGKTVAELYRMLEDSDEEAIVYFNRKHAVFKMGDYILFSRLIEGDYIEYEKFLPKEAATTVHVDSDYLISVLERAALVTEDRELGQKKSILRCDFEGSQLKISTQSNSGRFYDDLPIRKEGKDITIFFSCKRLLEAVRACSMEKLKLSLNTNLMGMVLSPANPDEDFKDGAFTIMVLPVRPPEENI
ncbi:MAG: DNA polymerase III subunit beta [Ruminococcaceae bacterium]|nr:DNA polymerase III subunit beta [Oscillospiraceae bacterium]